MKRPKKSFARNFSLSEQPLIVNNWHYNDFI